MKMSWLDRIIYFCFPAWLLNTTPWKDLWQEQEDLRALKNFRVSFFLLGLGYLLHYFFVDKPLGLTVDPVWFYYRFGIFSGCMAAFGLTYLPRKANFYSSVAYWLIAVGTCWAQARSMLWYSGVSPIWGFFIASSFAVFLRANSIFNMLMLTVAVGAQWMSFIDTNQNMNLTWGCVIVSYLFVIFSIRGRSEEIQNYIQTQKQIEIEKILANVQQDLADQIRAFLPGKINRELKTILRNGSTVTQAIEEVLRPKQKTIACLFSDIRGYTVASKKSEYILGSALPNIKLATSIVEENSGVPRLIGDLVFAYFENDKHHAHLLNSFQAANTILKENTLHNATIDEADRITRYVILDQGSAICGNLGGANSSREITALGVPVNRCARIDELTKNPKLRALFGSQAIVISEEYYKAMEEAGWQVEFEKINLKDFGLALRDFEDCTHLYFATYVQEIEMNPSGLNKLKEAS